MRMLIRVMLSGERQILVAIVMSETNIPASERKESCKDQSQSVRKQTVNINGSRSECVAGFVK